MTASTIAADHGLDPRALRRALRASDITKPGDTWRWKPTDPAVKEARALAKGLTG